MLNCKLLNCIEFCLVDKYINMKQKFVSKKTIS